MTDFEKIPERVSSHNLERSRRSSVLQGDVRRRLIIPVSLEIDFVSWETPRKFEISLTMAVPKCSRACHCHAVRIGSSWPRCVLWRCKNKCARKITVCPCSPQLWRPVIYLPNISTCTAGMREIVKRVETQFTTMKFEAYLVTVAGNRGAYLLDVRESVHLRTAGDG